MIIHLVVQGHKHRGSPLYDVLIHRLKRMGLATYQDLFRKVWPIRDSVNCTSEGVDFFIHVGVSKKYLLNFVKVKHLLCPENVLSNQTLYLLLYWLNECTKACMHGFSLWG